MNSPRISEPPDIARILAQPEGVHPDQVPRVREWVYEKPQRLYLQSFILGQLRHYLSAVEAPTEIAKHAEDVWQEFAGWVLPKVLTSYKPHPAFPLLDRTDIKRPRNFLRLLSEQTHALTAYLYEQLPRETQVHLAAYDREAAPPETLLQAVVTALNGVIQGGNLYSSDRFEGIRLHRETQDLLTRLPQEADYRLLNRLLLSTWTKIFIFTSVQKQWCSLFQNVAGYLL